MTAARALFAAASMVAVLASTGEAAAEPSSWLSVQGGEARLRWLGAGERSRCALPFDVGIGAPPQVPVMVGVGVRLTPYFGQGFDHAAYARVANRGYVLGRWGAALDAGGYFRKFGEGSSGWTSALSLGAPFGVVAQVAYSQGTNDARTLVATIGVDFLRLTVYRLAGESWWPNVNPAYRPRE
ncbi:MAG: hypothetical protein IT374_15205 [Polyangiaceae bacterium]|nr:hypothetical protein [Polyangiaceae bacterium]